MVSYTVFTLLTLTILLTSCFAHKLSFKDGTFKILQITDLHYGESTAADDNNVRITDELIRSVKPDVVLVTGDIISGYSKNGRNNYQREIWRKFTAPFIKNKVHYAFVLGNHDAFDGGLKPEVLIELEKASEYGLFKYSLDQGFPDFSYYLPVYSSIKENNISSMFWILNTNSAGCNGDFGGWSCMHDIDVEWYRNTSKKMDSHYGTDVHNLAFFHVAIPEYLNVYNEGHFYGYRGETISCPRSNSAPFKAFKEGNIQATFVGHDHNNDFGGWYDGIELVYGRKTGYGGYGPAAGHERGGRVITLTETLREDGSVKVSRDNYIVLPNGDADYQDSWFENELRKNDRPVQDSCPTLSSVNLQVQHIMFIICSVAYYLLA